MISKLIGKNLPDYTYSVPGMLFYFLDPSHTALGFKAHAACFNKKDLEVDLKGRSILVAGGNAGIGRSAAQSLAERGATVHIVCRSREKGEQAVADIKTATGNDDVYLHVVDLGSMGQVQAFTKTFAASGKPLHVLVNNAATMQSTRTVTPEGIETAQATNLLGFYGLTRGLLPVLKQNAPARIVNVVSAGMLASQFKLKGLTEEEKIEPYDGAAVYSLHHRARVMLTETWAEESKGSNLVVNCVHPGWVDTPLLRTAGPMEGFYKLMRGALRTELQGADTIVWLAASQKGGESTGKYFFDRKARWKNLLFANTKPEKKDYEDLVAFCEGKCPVWEGGK
ncbi:dehydrogenase reductase sdr family member 12 [Nannochloropsis oceanica]